MRQASWQIIRWPNKPAHTHPIDMECPHCGHIAALLVGASPRPIAAADFGFVFDVPDYPPPAGWAPAEIRCRKCRDNFQFSQGG